MDRLGPAALVIGLIALLLLLMWWGWRARAKRQAGYARPALVPTDLPRTTLTVKALYLSTTPADSALDRLVVPGLGFRADAVVSASAAGLVLKLRGEPEFFIAADNLVGIEAATLTIDRVVETDGLLRLRWMLGEDAVDSYFRLFDESDRHEFLTTVRRLAGTIHPFD